MLLTKAIEITYKGSELHTLWFRGDSIHVGNTERTASSSERFVGSTVSEKRPSRHRYSLEFVVKRCSIRFTAYSMRWWN